MLGEDTFRVLRCFHWKIEQIRSKVDMGDVTNTINVSQSNE